MAQHHKKFYLFKISIVSSNRTKYLSVRYVSATRLVVELVRGTWCCKTNTDWRLCTEDFVSERFVLTKPGQFLGDSRSEQFIHTAMFLHVHEFAFYSTNEAGAMPGPRDCSWEKRHRMVNC